MHLPAHAMEWPPVRQRSPNESAWHEGVEQVRKGLSVLESGNRKGGDAGVDRLQMCLSDKLKERGVFVLQAELSHGSGGLLKQRASPLISPLPNCTLYTPVTLSRALVRQTWYGFNGVFPPEELELSQAYFPPLPFVFLLCFIFASPLSQLSRRSSPFPLSACCSPPTGRKDTRDHESPFSLIIWMKGVCSCFPSSY